MVRIGTVRMGTVRIGLGAVAVTGLLACAAPGQAEAERACELGFSANDAITRISLGEGGSLAGALGQARGAASAAADAAAADAAYQPLAQATADLRDALMAAEEEQDYVGVELALVTATIRLAGECREFG